MRMTVYMDGGSKKLKGDPFGPPGKNHILSYGIVAYCNGETNELHGACMVKDEFCGHHELYAFVETVLHARALGVNPRDVSLVTDDAMVCNINRFYADNQNFHGSEGSLAKISKFCNEFYTPELYKECLEFLKHGHFTKIKGHRRSVENLRCDFLAVHARNWIMGDLSPLVPFDDWAHDGFTYYDRNQELQIWYAPFTDKHQMDCPETLDRLEAERQALKAA